MKNRANEETLEFSISCWTSTSFSRLGILWLLVLLHFHISCKLFANICVFYVDFCDFIRKFRQTLTIRTRNDSFPSFCFSVWFLFFALPSTIRIISAKYSLSDSVISFFINIQSHQIMKIQMHCSHLNTEAVGIDRFNIFGFSTFCNEKKRNEIDCMMMQN